MLRENKRLRELIQSSEIEPSGSGVNSGSGTPSGNTRRKRLAQRTAKGSIGAASAPSQPACMHSVVRAANRERAPAFSPNNATDRSIDSTILVAALRME